MGWDGLDGMDGSLGGPRYRAPTVLIKIKVKALTGVEVNCSLQQFNLEQKRNNMMHEIMKSYNFTSFTSYPLN